MKQSSAADIFFVRSLHLEEITANEFSEEAFWRKNSPVESWKLFKKPQLILYAQCPGCAHVFATDIYADIKGSTLFKRLIHRFLRRFVRLKKLRHHQTPPGSMVTCPKCGVQGTFDKADVVACFERQFRSLLADVGDDDEGLKRAGKILAFAALLLEPLCSIFIFRFFSHRIGHILTNTVIMLARLRKYVGEHCLVVGVPPDEGDEDGPCCNNYFLELWSRQLLITEAARHARNIIDKLPEQRRRNPAIPLPVTPGLLPERKTGGRLRYMAEKPLPLHSRHWIDLVKDHSYWLDDPTWEADDIPHPVFTFTEQEDAVAATWLKEHGLGPRYATFSIRDAAYLKRAFPNKTWQYHEYRNTNPMAYCKAMCWLADQGYGALRMGSAAEQPLDLNHPLILDYPFANGSDFLDVYLMAHSAFAVSTITGLDAIPLYMGIPLLMTHAPMYALFGLNRKSMPCFIAFSRLYDTVNDKMLTYKEIFERKFELFYRTNEYSNAGLRIIPHSEDVILEMTQEMYERFVTNTWVESAEEQAAQNALRHVVESFYPGVPCRFKLSYAFYKNNPDILLDA